MATDFWGSSHYKRWMVDRATLKKARAVDLQYVDDPEHLDFLGIFFANLIMKLAKKLQLRQRVIATATVFFRRFYLKNSYCETDPFIVIAACIYVAAKAEESPVHIKNVVAEARTLFSNDEYGIKTFPSDNSMLAEIEFYLVDDLECDLIVFHPYRTLMTLCGKEGSTALHEAEAGEVDAGAQEESRYWGSNEGKLELQEGALQWAWFIINDTYRSELCLLYPPHLIAIAAIYLTLVLHSSTRATIQAQAQAPSQSPSQGHIRRSSRSIQKKPQSQDIVGFMAGLNVNMSLIATIAQEILSLYTLWERYKEDASDTSARGSFTQTLSAGGSKKRSAGGYARSGSILSAGTPSTCNTPGAGEDRRESQRGSPRTYHEQTIVTPTFLTQLLLRMREHKMGDIPYPGPGRPAPLDKRLERAQAAG